MRTLLWSQPSGYHLHPCQMRVERVLLMAQRDQKGGRKRQQEPAFISAASVSFITEGRVLVLLASRAYGEVQNSDVSKVL